MKNKILVVFFIFIYAINVNAQGCSDAGFCSLSNLDESKKTTKNAIELGVVFGAAEEDVTVFSQFVTYTRNLSSQFAMSLKVTSAIANGNYGTRGNIGDALLSGNYTLKSDSETKKWSLLFGAKIPISGGNDKINGFSLPMVYQASLGTFDAIAGINYSYKKWDFNSAVQIPLTENKNSFQGSTVFTSTNLFKRQADALFRTTYSYKTKNEKFTFKPNMLFLYHLGEDSFVDIFNQRQNIKGSDGLTINANVIANYKLNGNSSLETSIATPFVIRDERPDGLTRAFTFGLSYKIAF